MKWCCACSSQARSSAIVDSFGARSHARAASSRLRNAAFNAAIGEPCSAMSLRRPLAPSPGVRSRISQARVSAMGYEKGIVREMQLLKIQTARVFPRRSPLPAWDYDLSVIRFVQVIAEMYRTNAVHDQAIADAIE